MSDPGGGDPPPAGTVAVVSGAGPGIGRACALALGLAGSDLVVAARDDVRLRALASELAAATGRTVIPHVVDVGVIASCQDLVARTVGRFGRIDTLVNVATAGGEQGSIDDADWSSWREAFEVNVLGTLELSRTAARAMAATGGGSIVQIGTVGTSANPVGRARYTATKAAMVSASRTLAKELGPANVRVNVVVPGYTAGPPLDAMTEQMAQQAGIDVDQMARRMARAMALGRVVDPSDVAQAVAFLAGPGGRNITGIELPVTAGL